MTLLEIKNLEKKFYAPDGSLMVNIRLPYLQLKRGRQLLLTGASGCGKSTILNIIAGLLSPDSGSIVFAHRDLTTLSAQELDKWRAKNIGYVFQNFNLLEELTVDENLMTAAWLAGYEIDQQLKERAHELLRQVGLEAKDTCYPRSLSLGEKQRIAVIRALLTSPTLVLADEPTASLDRVNAQIVLSLLQELCATHNAALLLSSHDEFVKAHVADSYDLVSGTWQHGAGEEEQ